MRHNKSKATLLVIVMLAISSSCDSLPLERTIRDSLKGSKPYFTSPQKMSRRFIAEPAGKGVTARFHCHADGNPTPRINWLKNHQEMDASNIRIDKVRIKKWSLILEDLLPSDSGLYTCIVGNQYGSINATYELEVIARVIKIPRLQSGLPKNQTAYIGDSVTFRCQVQSRDSLAPHIQWLKHTSTSNNDVGDAFSLLQREWPKHPEWNCVAMTRNLFEKSPFICIAPETDIGQPPIDPEKLRLTNVTFEDAAEYTCLAGNAIGIARRSAWLTVKRPPVAPSFIEELNTMVDASIGESVRFSCAATAYPTPSVIWYNKGKPITDFSNYLETSQTLIILYALPEDSGQYSCHVTNGHGDIWRNYSLSVGKNAVSDINSFAEYSSDEESILANYEPEPRNNSMETPPYFTSPQKMSRTSLTKTIGGYVRLRCPSGGHPEPEIKWSKNGHVLDSENLGYKVRHKKWTLILVDLLELDSGEYTCIVSNPHGSINASYRLDVVARNADPPVLREGMPKNSSALIGSSVVLKCEVVGEEVYPKLRWVKHVNSDVNIGDYSFKAVEYEWLNQPRTCIEIIAYLFDEIPPFVCLNKTDINSTWDINPNYLVLPNVTVEDAGKYTCLAGNSYGITYSSAWLSVIIPSTEVPESHTELTIDSATPSTPATIEMIFGHRTPEVLEEKKTIFQYIVIGACIGFVVTLMLIIIVICCLCRRGRNRRRHAHQNGDAKKKNKNAKHVKVEKKNEKVNDLEMAYQSVNTEDKKDDTSLQNETCLNGVSAKHDTCNGKNEQHRGSVETPDEEEALRSDEKSTTDEDDSDSDSEESDNVSENAESGKNDRSG